MLDILPLHGATPRILVFGVGGCGCNTINQLSQAPLNSNVQLIAINTDAQSLATTQCDTRIQIGPETTKGLGAGAKPSRGEQAAQESALQLKERIEIADVVFITGGMGGGTGTGAMPQIAAFAAELDKPLVAVVTLPFSFEGKHRNQLATEGVEQLMQHASAVIVLPNDQLAKTLGSKVTVINAFFQSNRILQDVLHGLTATISQSGLINIDLNDFIEIISHPGRAAMGVARHTNDDDLQLTINNALKNPLLEDIDLTLAKGAIVSVMASQQIELSQYHQIGETLQQQLSANALVIIGLTIVPELDCELELMVIATGIAPQSSASAPNIKTITVPHIDTSTLLNIHDFLNEHSANSCLDVDNKYQDTELDIPTYVRHKTNAKPSW